MPKQPQAASGQKAAHRELLTVVETTLDLAEICDALRLSPSEATSKFRDPRVTSWFAEIWGERLFGYQAHSSSNHPGSDASLGVGNLGRFDIGVRCFCGNGIKFQKSKFIGSGRKATMEDLVASIEDVERYVIVDLRQFPTLRFYPLDSKSLLRLVRQGKLTTSGISEARFDAWIAGSFDATVTKMTLPLQPAGPSAEDLGL